MSLHSLLSDPLFRVARSDGAVLAVSLPDLLAQLSQALPLDAPALRPHQRAPWHAFLVQLAYLALEEAGLTEPPRDADGWRQLLRGLTPDFPADEPWMLLVDDITRPAFLQPPCDVARAVDYRHVETAVQDVDLLVTSRHHDEKAGKQPITEDGLDGLVYALVTLQGWSSFMGAGNYHSMRLNGGFSSRSQFRLAWQDARGSGAEFCRDLAVLLEHTDALWRQAGVRGIGRGPSAPHRLLWLAPWNSGSLPLTDVHPYALEVCRRVRVARLDGRLVVRRAGSDGPRVDAKAQRGDVLDPWVPLVHDGTPKALTAQAHTLGYRKLHELLFDRTATTLPLLAQPSEREREANRPGMLIAQVLVMGDGRTDGLLAREVPVPAPVIAQWVTEPAALAARSKRFVEMAGLASGKGLRAALLQFVDGSAEPQWMNPDFARAVEPWQQRFDALVDQAFFAELFASVDAGLATADAEHAWAAWLAAACEALLLAAMQSLPTRERTRAFARARATALLRASLRKQFPGLWPTTRPAPEPELPFGDQHAASAWPAVPEAEELLDD